MAVTHDPAPVQTEVPAAVYARRWQILATLCLSLLVVMLANGSLNLALPSLSTTLALTSTELTWIVDIYALIFAGLLFTTGAVGDRYGRKLIMQIGLVLFLGASIYAGFWADSAAELIITRAVMGIGGAMVMPTTLSIVNTTFPRAERARAIAIWGAISGVGMMFGSVVSGFLMDHFNWNANFIFCAVIGVFALAVNQLLTPESRDEGHTPVDWLGAALSSAGLIGIVYAIIEAPTYGLTEPSVLAALIGGVAALGAFILWQLKTPTPMLDVRLFRRASFGVSALAVTLTFFALAGVFFAMSQLFQLVMGYTALESSYRMLPAFVPMLLLAPVVPQVVAKIGSRWPVVGGLGLVGVAFLVMSRWPVVPTYTNVLLGMGVLVVGMAFAMTPATNLLMSAVPRNRSGMGAAMNDTTRELGGALGIAVLGSLMSAGYASNLAGALTGLPDAVADLAKRSLGGALYAASEMGAAGAPLAEAARTAWMSGLSEAMVIAAVICFGAALLAAVALPHREEPAAAAELDEAPGGLAESALAGAAD